MASVQDIQELLRGVSDVMASTAQQLEEAASAAYNTAGQARTFIDDGAAEAAGAYLDTAGDNLHTAAFEAQQFAGAASQVISDIGK